MSLLLPKALQNLRPGSQWIIRDGDIEWLDTVQKKPSKKQIEAEIARMESEYVATEYQRNRAPEYPAITDQLDALFHAGVFPEEMSAKIQAVKDKYPKP